MRYLVGFVCVLAVVVLPLSVSAEVGKVATTSKPAGFVHAQNTALPLLMLRASYYYVDVDPLGAQPTREPATEAGQPRKRLSRGARIAIGVTVPIVVLGAGVGIAAALSPGLSVEVQP